jgi:hypothetical protein
VEPTTRSVLLEAFTEDECRTLCPRAQSKKNQLCAIAASKKIIALKALSPGTAEHATAMTELHYLMADVAKSGTAKGVRLDLQITLAKKELLCDFAGVHTTAPSSIPALKKWRQDITKGLAIAAEGDAKNPSARLPTPNIVKTVRTKHKRFDMLMQLAKAQYPLRRKIKPTLLIPIVTHSGEMSPDMYTLIEIMTSEAARNYTPSYLTMGQPRKRFTAAFRSRLKDAVMAANARGFGRALMAAGNPLSGHVVNDDDDDVDVFDMPDNDGQR